MATIKKTPNLVRVSGQDGGIGRNALLPRTTKRRITQFKNNKQPEVPENQTT